MLNYSLNDKKGGVKMAKQDKVKQAKNAAEGLKSKLKQFAKDTNDQEAAKMFKDLEQKVDEGTKELKQYKQKKKGKQKK